MGGVCGLLAGCFPVIAFTIEHFFLLRLGLFSETDCQFYFYLPYTLPIVNHLAIPISSSLHFTLGHPGNHSHNSKFPILNQITTHAVRTTVPSIPNPSPSFTYPQGSSTGKKPFNSAPNYRNLRNNLQYESSAHARKYTARIPFL